MEQSNSLKALRNASYSIIGFIWPLIFSLFFTPIIVFSLGTKEFGIYVFITTIVSLLGLLDLGVSTAVTKYIAEYNSQNNRQKLQNLIGSTQTIFLIMGVIGLIGVIGSMELGIYIFPNFFIDYLEYKTAIILAGGIFFINAISSVYTIIPPAIQRFDITTKVGICILTATNITTVIAVINDYSVTDLFVIQFIFMLISMVIGIRIAKKLMPDISFRFIFDKEEIKKCYSFGLVTFLNNLATSSLTYLDRLIIPFYVGPTNLTYYSLPGNASNRIPAISNSLTNIVFPMTAHFEGSGNREQTQRLYIRSLRLITIMAAVLTVLVVSFSYQILLYWLNKDFADTASNILIILAFTNFFLALSGVLSQFLLGMGKLRVLSIMSICTAVLNTILLVILIPHWGIMGAAWAYLLSLGPIAYAFFYTEKHIFALGVRHKHHTHTWLKIILIGGILYILNTFVLAHLISNMFTLLLVGFTSFCIFIVLYKLCGFFETEDWNDFERFFQILIKKVRRI